MPLDERETVKTLSSTGAIASGAAVVITSPWTTLSPYPKAGVTTTVTCSAFAIVATLGKLTATKKNVKP